MEFITEDGIKVPAVTAKQMKEIDRTALEETGPNIFQMMENAGRNLAELTMKVLGKNKKQNVVILAGTGGNGGGGICAARHLVSKGYNVKMCVTDGKKLKDATAYQLHILRATDAKIISVDELQNERPDLIIDAIIGYGLNGEPKGTAKEFIKWVNHQLAIIISLDVPSGINATTGKQTKFFIKPDLTLTLALPKTGFLAEVTGELFLADIGIPHKTISKMISAHDINTFRSNYLVRLTVHN